MMSAHDVRSGHPVVRVFVFSGILIVFALLLLLLAAIFDRVVKEGLLHLAAGWVFFLQRNLEAAPWDPAILASGAVTAVLALLLTHAFARFLAGKRWRWRDSFAILGFLFTGFAAAFIVPGVLLMLRTPMDTGWIDRISGSRHASAINDTQELTHLLITSSEGRDYFPASLESLARTSGDLHTSFAWTDGFLYPGAGLPVDADRPMPLILSPAVRGRDGTVRIVGLSDGSYRECGEAEVEALLSELTPPDS